MKTLRFTEDGPQFEIVDAMARKQIDTLLLGGGADVSVTVNADLAQNDEAAASYVRNRTHWTDDDGTVHPLPEKYLPADVLEQMSTMQTEIEDIRNSNPFQKDESGWAPVETMDGAQWTELGYYWYTDGTLVSTQYTTAYQSTTEKIPVAPNCSYTVNCFAGIITLYDKSGANGTPLEDHYDPNTSFTFETGADQYYMGVSHRPTGDYTVDRVSIVRTTMSEEEYAALPTKADTLKSLYGKKVVCFGDSLFGMYRGDDSAPAFIALETGATVYNVGFGGCRMSVHPTTGYAAFSMWALAKAIAENDWTDQDAQAASGSDYFPEQLALLRSIDFSDVDIAVIHYGTNDFAAGSEVELDNAADPDDYTTLCGALRYSIEKLLGAYPNLRIYISLPVYRYWTADDGSVTYSEAYTNVGGKTLPQFVEALRNVAAEYNLPVIDGYYGLGINKANASAFLSDGTHHNSAGRERFGRFIGTNLLAQQTTGKSGVDADSVAELFAAATSAAFVKDGSTITATVALDDGTTSTSTITLDDNGYPSQIVTDGVTCAVSWEGFSDE